MVEWELVRDRVVMVHDLMRPEEVLDLIEIYSGETSREVKDGNPRDLFKRMNQMLSDEKRFRFLGSLGAPMSADVWDPPTETEQLRADNIKQAVREF